MPPKETGELHNNARMGWGKAVARWTASPVEALETLLELGCDIHTLGL